MKAETIATMAESVQQLETNSLRERQRRVTALALRFALNNLPTAILLSIFPVLLSVGAKLWMSSYALKPNGLFVIFVIFALALCWQITSIASFLVSRLRGEPGSRIGVHIGFGISASPKVLLSYGILFGTISLSSLGALGSGEGISKTILSLSLIFSIFLLWAPAFVAGENFAKPLPERDDEEFDPFEDDLPLSKLYAAKYFSGMGVIDLGIDRSIQFTTRHLGFAIEVLAVIWFIDVIPQALAILLFGKSFSAAAVVFETVLSGVLFGVLMLYAGYAFLHLLPKEAREELEMNEQPQAVRGVAFKPVAVRVAMVLLLGVSFLATGYLYGALKNEFSFPEDVGSRLLSQRVEGRNLFLSLEVEDSRHRYRWFQPTRFGLEVSSVQDEPDESVGHPKKGGLMELLSRTERASTRVLPAKDLTLFSESGDVLNERYFAPYLGKVRVELSFDVQGVELKGGSLVYLPFQNSQEEPYLITKIQ